VQSQQYISIDDEYAEILDDGGGRNVIGTGAPQHD